MTAIQTVSNDLAGTNDASRWSSQEECQPRLPSIILNTLPKSGSVFLARTLAEGLGFSLLTISQGYFPTDLVDFGKLKSLAEGNALTQAHLDASAMNYQLIGRFFRQMVLHVRDPRPAMLSWVHHLNRLAREGQNDFLHWVCPMQPSAYYQRALADQVDWNLENYLPACADWLENWLHAIDHTPELNVLVTRYEDFVRDDDAFLATILDFYGIPGECFRKPAIAKTLEVNYRQGKADAWREQLTPRQRARARDLIPERLFARFDWCRE